MTKTVLLVFLVLVTIVTTEAEMASNEQLANNFDEIMPDVIDTWPKEKVLVTYPNNKEVDYGNELTPLEVQEQPRVYWKTEPDTYYTLAMIDPDAPSRANPQFREVKHWLVVNILGCNIITSGETIAEYIGSGPPKDTGLHRYIFLVYKQSEKLNSDEPKSAKLSRQHRLKFSIRNFAKKYNLGEPIAANYYKAQWDPYVEIRNKEITN